MWSLLALFASAPAWMWTSPETGPWRVPLGARTIEIVNDSEIAVATRQDLIVVNRQTGAVDAPVQVITDGWIESLAMVHGRLIAFGELSNNPAAWELNTSPPSGALLDLDDPGGGAPGYGHGDGLFVSPDGTKILVCGQTRGPTVRDAATLAVVATALTSSCDKAFWADNSHVVVGKAPNLVALDVAANKTAPYTGNVAMAGGKRGLVWRTDSDGYQLADSKGPIRQHLDWSIEHATARFSPDRSFVVAPTFNSVQIIPTARDGTDKAIEIPYGSNDFAIDNNVAVMLISNAIVEIDLRTGNLRQPEGNLSHVSEVAPRNGLVYTAADKLRIWRDGKVDRVVDASSDLAVGDSKAPIALVTPGGAGWWDPDSDFREDIPGTRWVTDIFRFGTRLVLVSFDELFKVDPTGAQRWLQFVGGVDSVDVKRERVAMHTDDVTYIIDTVKHSAWPLVVNDGIGGCTQALEVRFSPDGTRVAAYGDGGLFVFDVRTGKPIGKVALTDQNVIQWQFLPNGDIFIAAQQELVVWEAKTKRAVGFATTVDDMPIGLGLSADGKEAALAFVGGRVMWTDVAGLRENASVRPSSFDKFTVCKKVAAKRYDDLTKR